MDAALEAQVLWLAKLSDKKIQLKTLDPSIIGGFILE
jgi:hypothetical protein